MPKVSRRASVWFVATGAALVLLTTGALVFVVLHHNHVQAVEVARLKKEADAGPKVLVRKIFKAPEIRTVELPANARAYAVATLYAKTAGYVKEMRTDKGRAVKAGDILAVISSPEVDQQVDAARANLFLQQKTAARADFLAKSGVVSLQEKDNADANLRTARAALTQQLALQKYEQIIAPFDGLCTARYVDPGALIPAATGSTQAALPVVDVADPNHIRVQVFVGQDMAPFVSLGDVASIWQDERPDELIAAQVTLASGSLDSSSRTELVELQFDNREVGMLPGTFVHVALKVHSQALAIAPVEALVVREGKLYMAVVGGGEGEEGTVKLRPVQIGNNDGQELEVISGLQGNEEVALNLPAEIVDGERIQPVRPKQGKKPQPAEGQQPPAGDGQLEAAAPSNQQALADEAAPDDANDQPSAFKQRASGPAASDQTGHRQGPRDQPGMQPPPAAPGGQ